MNSIDNKCLNLCGIIQESLSPRYRACIVHYLGLIEYERCLVLQQTLQEKRIQGVIPDVLLLLQHFPVFTLGRFRGIDHLIVPQEALPQKGITIFHTNRGGGITYHGPGQLVVYPVLNLKENHIGVREYIWKLEDVVLKSLQDYGIKGKRVYGYTGVWIGNKKVCSIGIHVSHQVTTHGFALNINTDLEYFNYINPCGLPGEVMTSISEMMGYQFEFENILKNIVTNFSKVFGLRCYQGNDKCLITLEDRNG
jgi:lipoate-protein ligase B